MPTVAVSRDGLMAAIGQQMTDTEFEDLCFEFGIELDDITTEALMQRKEKGDAGDAKSEAADQVVYKIDITANRYDLLCLEGLALALNVFRKRCNVPSFKSIRLPNPNTITVAPSCAQIRPFVVGCVLRGIKFDAARYNSFIELQDKLHENICRRRTLVAIGTHDLDTIEGPFSYEALAPKDISFAPLNNETVMDAATMMEHFEKDMKLKHYLHIIKDSPVYPVIYDSKRRVLSLPPIINGNHSKISLETKNVLIECTATDLTRAKIVLDTMVAMFSGYCAEPFTCEDVRVVSADGTETFTPDIKPAVVTASVDAINRTVGVKLSPETQIELLHKMQLTATFDASSNELRVSVPPTRHDVLQACDIAEDVAIAYGYNNIPRTVAKTNTVGKQQPMNKMSDLLRGEVAQAGFNEILTFGLCSHAEAFSKLRREDDGQTAVVLSNPKTADFEICRPALLPGMLKTMGNAQKMPKPIKLFEITDVVLKDPTTDVGACNRRHLIAMYGGNTSGFEVVHGLLDHIMTLNGIPMGDKDGYALKEAKDGAFFDGRCAHVMLRGEAVGVTGMLHPEALEAFDIPFPCSCVEIRMDKITGIKG
uniref:phenylalanine--tRNA ligase n=2 Tax=Hemiselmis andersenii TaxID=464988 RepID=A0A6U2AIS2_HEMAN